MKNHNNISIAKRYAKSLFELNLEQNISQDVIVQNLDSIEEILKSSSELYTAMTNPVISAYDKEQIVDAVFERDTNENARKFLKLLIDKNRFNLIFQIINSYREMLNNINNIANIDITSAIELNEGRKKEIEEKIKNNIKKDIIVNYKIDNKIIAGLIYKIGDDMLNTSFLKRIEDIKKELIKY